MPQRDFSLHLRFTFAPFGSAIHRQTASVSMGGHSESLLSPGVSGHLNFQGNSKQDDSNHLEKAEAILRVEDSSTLLEAFYCAMSQS